MRLENKIWEGVENGQKKNNMCRGLEILGVVRTKKNSSEKIGWHTKQMGSGKCVENPDGCKTQGGEGAEVSTMNPAGPATEGGGMGTVGNRLLLKTWGVRPGPTQRSRGVPFGPTHPPTPPPPCGGMFTSRGKSKAQ